MVWRDDWEMVRTYFIWALTDELKAMYNKSDPYHEEEFEDFVREKMEVTAKNFVDKLVPAPEE